ncbi:hypothetical protein [Nocardioides sp. SYSU D00038]|uniref:hypothetical protein n=1 Tax=Nocardioides sp. SYSU D00038 TaxID=2812554 RepID=UPI0019685F4B|nr:hypothetical protein [Nocardioides sp. SYSU D00038]
MTLVRELRGAAVDAALVVADGVRLAVRHWPALVSIFLLGLAARNAAMWGAVVLGREHPVLASLLVPLAPLAMVVALVAMLGAVRPSTRWVGPGPAGTRGERLAVLAAALVPFLTVYAIQGHLDEDRNQFINESYADEVRVGDLLSGGGLDDRTLVTVTSWQLALVAVALLLRTVMDRVDLADRHVAGGLAVALVEVTWLTWLASILTSRWGDARDWVGERVVARELAEGWHGVTAALGPFTAPVRALGDLVGGVVTGVGDIVVTPVAWLTVGAIVLTGMRREGRRARLEDHHVVTRVRDRIDRVAWLAERRRRAGDALGRRFEELVAGLRTTAHAGVVPVLAFCLVLTLARFAEWGAAMLLRAAIGPRDPGLMVAASPYLEGATRLVHTVVVVVLVAAAVDRLLARRELLGREALAEDAEDADAGVSATRG